VRRSNPGTWSGRVLSLEYVVQSFRIRGPVARSSACDARKYGVGTVVYQRWRLHGAKRVEEKVRVRLGSPRRVERT
jgi:hypothetical protein